MSKLNRILRSPWTWALGLLAALAAGFGFVAGGKSETREIQEKQTRKLLTATVPRGTVNENTGAYRGVSLGAPATTVIRKLGRPIDPNAMVSIPQVANYTAWNGIDVNCRPRPARSMVYREVVVNLSRDRVCAFEIAGAGWRTDGGIKAGDPVSVVQARFGTDSCHEWNPTEDPFWSQWECAVKTSPQVKLRFAGEPLTWVVVTASR